MSLFIIIIGKIKKIIKGRDPYSQYEAFFACQNGEIGSKVLTKFCTKKG